MKIKIYLLLIFIHKLWEKILSIHSLTDTGENVQNWTRVFSSSFESSPVSVKVETLSASDQNRTFLR